MYIRIRHNKNEFIKCFVISTDNINMEEITLKLSAEQYALIQKMLEPYVKLSVNLANQYKIQQDIKQRTTEAKGKKE